MVRRRGENGIEGEEEDGDKRAEYEESRAQRMKENMERMKSLGIAELSKQLNPPGSSSVRKRKLNPKPKPTGPPRRSSRLKDVPQVTNAKKKPPKQTVKKKNKVEIRIQQGQNPEIYTDEHEKLLGDSEAAWSLYVDGYGDDGMRIYDPYEGKSCHQCRQKTLGMHTKCSKCTVVSGQFCGDCLYMRYGENVGEVNLKQDWVCPVCRGICNCSRCRRDKGWNPTGSIYKKVRQLGFKSVAHYLIHTRREGVIVTESSSAAGDDESEGGSSDAVPSKEHEIAEDMIELDSDSDNDSEYEGE